MANPINILAIDDDPVDLQVLRRYLSKIDGLEFELLERTDSDGAHQALATQSIDLVFLDFRLGAENGLHVLKTLRSSGSTCPVIFLTGQGNERIAAEVRRAGGDDYLLKEDLSPESLKASMDFVLEAFAKEQEQIGFDQMLARMATVDQLTGLLKRHVFLERLSQECARAERYRRPLSLLAVDVDGFMNVVHDRGEAAADQILATMAVTLRGVLRTTDHFCRYEADRFLVALTETDRELALGAAARVTTHVRDSAYRADAGEPVDITCSVGVAVLDAEDPNAERALVDAFSAVARAKDRGGNCYVVLPQSGADDPTGR